MKILFTMLEYNNESSNMYSDLAEEFINHNHAVTIITPANSAYPEGEYYEMKIKIIRANTPQSQGVSNLIKKGISLALMPHNFIRAYKRYLGQEHFDLIFMPTPPITLIDFVSYVKKRTKAKFYLILRDIHPQSAASIGLIKYKFMYDYLEHKAQKAYKLANWIGCMSQGNIDFISNHYPFIDKSKLLLLQNWQKKQTSLKDTQDIRGKYGLNNKILVLFGGNIGLGQKVENIFSLMEHNREKADILFLIVGKGIAKDRLLSLVREARLENVRFFDFLPRDEYLRLIKSVDIGLISINEDYKVPTCPSKAVSYMSLGIPILAMINPNNDYGDFIENAGAGYWAVASDKKKVFELFDKMCDNNELRKQISQNGYRYFCSYLTSESAYEILMRQINYGKA